MIERLNMTINRFTNRLFLLFSREPWWVEFWSAFSALLWAYFSILSGQDVYYTSIFAELSLIAHAEFWQSCAIVVGGTQLILLFIDDYRLRWIVCFFASWFWAFLTLVSGQSDPNPPGIALYASYACINLVSMIKLSRSYYV